MSKSAKVVLAMLRIARPLLACALALANAPANVHPSRKCYRAHKVREHDRDLAAFGIVDDLAGAAAATASAASAPDVQYGLLLPPMCPPLFGRIDVKSETAAASARSGNSTAAASARSGNSTAAASARRGDSTTAASARSCTAASAGSSASTAPWRTAAASTDPDRQAQVPAGSTMLNAGEVPWGSAVA